MATKKGICPYCNPSRNSYRYFLVNPDASACFCPSCMKEMEPATAIEEYGKMIDAMVDKADDTLFVACDPASAYKQYAQVLEIEPVVTRSFLGRILCLVYMSKVRRSYLKEAYILLKNECDQYYHKASEISTYVAYLKQLNSTLDEYEYAVKHKLTFKDLFYDLDCLQVYWRILIDVKNFKELILSELVFIKKNYANQSHDIFINLLEHSVAEEEELLNAPYYLVNGVGYKFAKLTRGEELKYIEVPGRVDTHLNKYRMATLDPTNKKLRYIKDEVFHDYTPMIRMSKALIVFSILAFILSVGSGISAFIFKENLPLLIVFAALGGLFFIAGIVCIILRIRFTSILHKRKLHIV